MNKEFTVIYMAATKEFSIEGATDFVALLKGGWVIERADSAAEGIVYILSRNINQPNMNYDNNEVYKRFNRDDFNQK